MKSAIIALRLVMLNEEVMKKWFGGELQAGYWNGIGMDKHVHRKPNIPPFKWHLAMRVFAQRSKRRSIISQFHGVLLLVGERAHHIAIILYALEWVCAKR